MQTRLKVVVASFMVLSAAGLAVFAHLKASDQASQSPYSSQLSSSVRGLSAQEVDDLLNGRGAGYARIAELNSYPGPLHVLELKEQLELSAEQIQTIESVFQAMNREAKEIGQEIVEREQDLSTAFANNDITPTELQRQTQLLAELYGELRRTHLEAHLEVTPMLAPKQIAAYDALRGYTSGEASETHHHHKH